MRDAPTPSSIDPAVLAMLRCPRTGAPLKLAARSGRSILTTDDGTVYEIRDGIPVLLPPDPTPIPHPKDSHPWPKAST